jgi:hypothetical protein
MGKLGQSFSALREADFDDLRAETKEKLTDIARRCEPSQRNQQKPRYFSVSLQWRGQRFNHVVLADVVNFADGDLVHIVDAATKLNAARFPKANKNPSAAEIWSVIRECGINVYVGSPDILQFDPGTSMTSAFVQTAYALNGIQFEAIPTEAPWRQGQVERAHEPLRVAYNKLKAELPDLDRDALLSFAVKSVNDAVGPAGVSPMIALFGTAARHYPALLRYHAVVHTDWIRAMEDARKTVEKYQAQASIRAALQHRGPNPGEQDLVVGDTVLTFRKNKGWVGPFQFISLTEADGEVRDSKVGVTVLRTRIKKFLNPYPGEHEFRQDFRASVLGHADIHVTDEPLSTNSILPEEFAGVTPEAADALYTSLADVDVIVGNPEQPNDLADILTFETRVYPPSPEKGARFAASRKAEINGLLEANVFGVMKRSDAIADGRRILSLGSSKIQTLPRQLISRGV